MAMKCPHCDQRQLPDYTRCTSCGRERETPAETKKPKD